MATAALITASEYLRMSFEHDAEFVDDHIEERTVGERDHSALQKKLLFLLSAMQCEPYFEPFQELRVQVSPSRFRVPDLTLVAAGAPDEQIVRTPPLLCIEVLSPEDTMSRTLVRVRDFLAMGVPEVWIVDPELRSIHVCAGNTLTEHRTGSLIVPGTPVAVSLDQVFSVPRSQVISSRRAVMATAAVSQFVTIEEYLHTLYRPDVDYVDGQLEERNLGEFDHGNLQWMCFHVFHSNRALWRIRPALDCRVQVSATRFRVPDVCIVSAEQPKEQIIRHAPMLCIEIVSPEDTLARLERRSEDFFAMGVPAVWIVDPSTRTVHIRGNGLVSTQSTGTLTLPGTHVAVSLEEVFSILDED